MKPSFRIPAVGIEEEYQLVDDQTGELTPTGSKVLRYVRNRTEADIQHELHLEQIEMATPILNTSEEIGACIYSTRSFISEAARASRSLLIAAGTHPMVNSKDPNITPSARYLAMAEKYKALATDFMIFGLHVHLDMPDRDLGVSVMNRLRPWMPLLQAISANSPYWNGSDTGYASFRRELWAQWPLAGIPQIFDDYADYDACVTELVESSAIDDASKIYWDMRLPIHIPTLEIRVCDVITRIDQVIAIVAVIRALVMRSEFEATRQSPFKRDRQDLLRSAMWQAARFGLSKNLIDPETSRPATAHEMLDRLLDYTAIPLNELGDLERVQRYIEELKSNGSPSHSQHNYMQLFKGDMVQFVKQLAKDTLVAPD